MKVSKKNIRRWANALRSGKYKQTKWKLQTSEGFCCLGVACRLFAPKYRKFEGVLAGSTPIKANGAPRWVININDDVQDKLEHSLTYLNDHEALSFDEIADVLELIYIHKAL